MPTTVLIFELPMSKLATTLDFAMSYRYYKKLVWHTNVLKHLKAELKHFRRAKSNKKLAVFWAAGGI